MGLSDAQIEQYQEAFKTFDQDEDGNNTGVIDAKKFKSYLRSIGFNPTEKVLGEYLAALKKETKITFDDCKPYIEKLIAAGRDNVNDMLEAFKIFDKEGMGFIGLNELRHILLNMAEKFTDEEAAECINALDDHSGQVNYADLVKQICS